jgi:hypothetical protein
MTPFCVCSIQKSVNWMKRKSLAKQSQSGSAGVEQLKNIENESLGDLALKKFGIGSRSSSSHSVNQFRINSSSNLNLAVDESISPTSTVVEEKMTEPPSSSSRSNYRRVMSLQLDLSGDELPSSTSPKNCLTSRSQSLELSSTASSEAKSEKEVLHAVATFFGELVVGRRGSKAARRAKSRFNA